MERVNNQVGVLPSKGLTAEKARDRLAEVKSNVEKRERRKLPETRRRERRKHEMKIKCKTTKDGDGIAKQCLVLRL